MNIAQHIAQHIAQELSVDPARVEAAIALLNEGATVPFIARYRKEATGGLDDTQLRRLEERLGYLTELEARRASVLSSIEEQGKLSPELKREILAAETKTRLEDLYRPYMKKRRTKAQVAREAGLEPLARGLSEDPSQVPETLAADFVDPEKGITDTKAALEGARQILMEDFAEDAELVGNLRGHLEAHAILRSRLMSGKGQEGAKFSDYFEYEEPLRRIPSHRALALFRGRKEGILGLSLVLPEDEQGGREAGEPGAAERRIAAHFRIHDRGRPADAWLRDTVRWAWRVKISLRLELDLLGQLRERAEAEAIGVFGKNLNDLLLAAPAGPRTTMGLDPGLRTGVKVAVVDATGKVLDTATIYPHPPKKQWGAALHTVAGLARKHHVELVSIGNGTASRETDRLVAELIRRHPELGLTRLVVSEAGASVYSASETAAREFPDLDVSLRGAVSIARRLQDPLAELVKIEPKSIGVGQYQHDVAQTRLARTLEAVVEDCVNAVGVDVNTASAPLLTRVAGLSATLADNIVQYRDQSGAFRNRRELLKVPRLGKKAFEQSAGFLRIAGGDNPLDASAVHPEAYPVVERISRATAREVEAMIGEGRFLQGLCPADYTDERFGEPTVRDILAELEKPGRDPRPEFRTAAFQDGVEAIGDLKPGMVLEGVVTNVTNFGAFVDIGVHQDGLVHISALSERFVKDPREVVKAGQVVKVKVMNVDLERRRIGLSMRLNDDPRNHPREPGGGSERGRGRARSKPTPEPAKPTGAMAEAFARLRR
jgi:uncharacterized protein